jgi:hypothetical protein
MWVCHVALVLEGLHYLFCRIRDCMAPWASFMAKAMEVILQAIGFLIFRWNMLGMFLVLAEIFRRAYPLLVGICVLDFQFCLVTLISAPAVVALSRPLIATSAMHCVINQGVTLVHIAVEPALDRDAQEVGNVHVEGVVEDDSLVVAEVETLSVYVFDVVEMEA